MDNTTEHTPGGFDTLPQDRCAWSNRLLTTFPYRGHMAYGPSRFSAMRQHQSASVLGDPSNGRHCAPGPPRMSETFIALAYQYGAICLPRSFEILGIGKDLGGRLIHSGRGISVAVPSASRRAVRSPQPGHGSCPGPNCLAWKPSQSD